MRQKSPLLVDVSGRPFTPRIEEAVLVWAPRLRARFPGLADDTAYIEILEEAAQRVARREARGGPIEHVHAYAWTAIRSVAVSRARLGRERVAQRANEEPREPRVERYAPGRARVAHEDLVLLSELLATLTPTERTVCQMKFQGFSTREIGACIGRAPTTVDSLHSRAMAKLRRLARSPWRNSVRLGRT